jgi:predicted Zn-dependent peptidase
MPAVESVSLGIWVGVGTRHEEAAQNGISHLLEHMAFKGTPRRSATQIAEEIEAVGGHLNAYTSREATAFYAKVLSPDVPLALDIIADILQNPLFETEELQREKTVILQEIGQANDTPDDVIFDRFQEIAYPDQPLGRPVLGRAEIVSELGADALRGYLGRNYRASNLVLVASGKIQHQELLALAEQAFAGLSDGAVDGGAGAIYQGGEYHESRDLEQVHLLLGFDSVSYHDEDYYAASTLSTLFGGGMSSRLFQEVRERRGLVYSIYSFASPYRDGGVFGIYAGTGDSQVEELLSVVCQELGRLPRDIEEQEIERAKAQLKSSILMALESSSARCEHLAQQLLIFGRPLEVTEIVARIDAVDREALARCAGSLIASPPTFASIGPMAAPPQLSDVSARLLAAAGS